MVINEGCSEHKFNISRIMSIGKLSNNCINLSEAGFENCLCNLIGYIK